MPENHWRKLSDVEPAKGALIAFKLPYNSYVQIGIYGKDGFVAGNDLSEGYMVLPPDVIWIEVPPPEVVHA